MPRAKDTMIFLTPMLFAAVVYGQPPKFVCGELEGTDAQAQLTYLQQERSGLVSGCVGYSIYHLGVKRSANAIKILVKYLDYRMPDERPSSPVVQHAPTLGTLYPAVTALFQVGKPAVPALIEAIGASGTSDVVRHNAVDSVELIYRDDISEAVKILSGSSKASTASDVSRRLLDAAREVALRCPVDMANRCLDALDK